MSELEATEQVYSLEGLHKVPSRRYDTQHASSAAKKEFTADAPTVISNAWLARDRSLASSIDVTKLDLSWVNETDDALFAALSRTERQLLYLVFAREMPWKDVAESFDMGPERLSGGMSACSPRLNRELHRQ
jgi:hypothetical protein